MTAMRLFTGLLFTLLFFAGEASRAQRSPHPPYEPGDPCLLDGLPNLFLKAKVNASVHWSDRVPEFAVDGCRTLQGDHWAAENIPVMLTVDMEGSRAINAVRLWTYWDGKRFYQYLIEGSQDGREWGVLVDQRKNSRPASAKGEAFLFPEKRVRYVRTTFTHNSAGNKTGGHIVEIEGFRAAPAVIENEIKRIETWEKVAPGLNGKFGSIDVRYRRNEVPAGEGSNQWSGTAWKGERLHAQVVLWTLEPVRQVRLAVTPFRNGEGESLGAEPMRAFFVRYVLGEGMVVGDVLDTAPRLDMPARSVRPAWVAIDVPADASEGTYKGSLRVEAEGGLYLPFEFEVQVLPLVLPPPAEWKFHLDLWQNPYAVARYHRVEFWSPEHWTLLEPLLRMLAEAGQKCLSTTILHQPWGGQTFDPFESMVKWIRRKDGSWDFNYTLFDRYVEFGTRCGLDKAINCYSMVPWTNRIRYLDEAKEDYVEAAAKPGDPLFEEIWQPFLEDFAAHLRERGWLGRAVLAMDERPIELMKPAAALIRRVAPELKIALAGSNEPRLKEDIDDWSVFISPPLDPAIARERSAKNLQTTFYVCCAPKRPNTFTFSPPAEAAWLGLYAAAQGYTGFLRWAYNSWVEDPLCDTNHVTWPAGDCFLVYPGSRSSIRFERLREGIQDYEKIRILRETAVQSDRPQVRKAMQELEAVLARFTYDAVAKKPAEKFVSEAKKALEKVSSTLAR